MIIIKKADFTGSWHVKQFISWIQQILDLPGSFYHRYYMKKPSVSWDCDSIYSALEKYSWKYSTTDPLTGHKVTGSSFIESVNTLSKLSQQLKSSIQAEDCDLCIKCCLSILEWGGVRTKNDKKVEALGTDICRYLTNVRSTLSDENFSLEFVDDFIIMNSGFAKIYSQMIDDFIIYDGRVGAALGLLVRGYCQDNQLERVPCELEFAWGRGKESTYTTGKYNKRNPSSEKYKFPELSNNSKRHLENNIRANWLLKEIIEKTQSKFNMLEKSIQLRAFESALFMIGYNVNEPLEYSVDLVKW